jgi:peptidoglycan/LPS O-acetylase OafA/YrhL
LSRLLPGFEPEIDQPIGPNQPRSATRPVNGQRRFSDSLVILSGFVITYLLERKSPGKIEFLTGRFFRLWPLLAVCLFTTFLLEPFERQNLNALVDVMPSAEWRLHRLEVWDHRDVYYLPISLLMLHASVPEFVFTHCAKYRLSPAWSIGLEWSFYLVAPFVIHAIRTKGRQLQWLFGVLLACVFFGWVAKIWNPSSLPVYAPLFALGIGSYYLFTNSASILAKVPVWMVVSVCLAAGAAGGEAPLIWSIVFLGLIPEIRGESAFLQGIWRILGTRPLLFLGKISYSTYLAHWLVLTLVQWISLNRLSITPETMGTSPLTWLLFISGTFLASVTTYYLIEQPSIRLGKNVTRLLFHRSA